MSNVPFHLSLLLCSGLAVCLCCNYIGLLNEIFCQCLMPCISTESCHLSLGKPFSLPSDIDQVIYFHPLRLPLFGVDILLSPDKTPLSLSKQWDQNDRRFPILGTFRNRISTGHKGGCFLARRENE